DADIVAALRRRLEKERARLEIVAPAIGGVEAADGTWIDAEQTIAGGPSVLYDAIALLPSEEGARALAAERAALDFVTAAFAHAKFIGYAESARPLLQGAGIAGALDDGCRALADEGSASRFIDACAALRFWPRLHPGAARAR